MTNSSFASPASVLESLAKEAIKAVGGEIGKAAIEKFKDLFNSNKEIAKKGNPTLTLDAPLKNKRIWTISPGNLNQKDLEKLVKILKSLDNDTDQVIKIKGSDNVVVSTQNGNVSFGTYQKILGNGVNSINQEETKTININSPGSIVNSPGAIRIENCKTIGDNQVENRSVLDLIRLCPAIDEVIKGIKSCRDLAPEAQTLCIKENARLSLAAMVLKEPRFTAEQIVRILQQPSLSDMKRVFNETLTIVATASVGCEGYTVHVPLEVAVVYVFLQKPTTLGDGSSEFLGRVSRDEFIKKWDEYVKIAKSKQMKLIVRASTADEKKWLQGEIKYNDKMLMKSAFRDPSNNEISEGAEVPLN